MALNTGFNSTAIREALEKIGKSYESLMQALGTNMQSQFVNGMSDKWACQYAIDFFTIFAEGGQKQFEGFSVSLDKGMNAFLLESDDIFTRVFISVNSAAKRWAEVTGKAGAWGTMPFTALGKKMDISCIQENINDVRGVDDISTPNVLAQLRALVENAREALDSAKAAVTNCGGFLDQYGMQSDALTMSISAIARDLNNFATTIQETADKSIKATIETYGTIARNVADAYDYR